VHFSIGVSSIDAILPGGGLRSARRFASLIPIRYSHVKNCERSSNFPMLRQARRKVSCVTSCASSASATKRSTTA
jgi:hypothetical protein